MTDTLTVVDGTDRWRPTRAGLVGLWRYWDETFTFHHGRLLLRGPNGSGKSMALELLLPFLLDGDSSPARLTSAAKSRGRLYDRMLTGSDETTRTGFAWVEFRRAGDVFTVGARMRASRATNKVDLDLFTTTLMVGRDLHLLDPTRTPLSKKALADAIGDTGGLHASAEEHRAAVRDVLFPGFGPDRYASVLGALLALRKEKLSQNLDLDKLSDVLSEALPPIDEQDVAAVAEGFERLDRRRAELAALERDLTEVKGLARQQRDYARAVVVDAARDVRQAQTRRDGVTRTEREAREALQAAQARASELTAAQQRIEERYVEIDVEVAAYKDSDAYREGSGLADLCRQAGTLRSSADRLGQAAAERQREHEASLGEVEQAAGTVEGATSNVALAARDLRAAGEPVGAATAIAEAERADEPDDAERLLHGWIRSQRARLAEVRAALETHRGAAAQRDFLDGRLADEEAAVDERQVAVTAAEQVHREAVEAYRVAVDAWVSGCEYAGPSLASRVPIPPEDPAAVAGAVADVASAVRAESLLAHREVERRRQVAVDERAGLVDERSRWEHGRLVDPDGPSWRADRAGRSGAPLWRLVDIAPEATDADVDGVEAALTGAGLLDAWVSPDGMVDVAPDHADVTLTVRPLAGRTLRSVLTPVADADVPVDVVTAVLSSIRLCDAASDTDAEVAIATDGGYRISSAVGRGPLRPAAFVGGVARERHRLARLAEFDALIAAVDERLGELDREQAELRRHDAAVDAELAAQPSGDAVLTAVRMHADATTRLAEARQRRDRTRDERRGAEDAVRQAVRGLTALAVRHGLPADADGLRDVEAGLQALDTGAVVWARRRRELLTATLQHQRALRRAGESEGAAQRALADHAAVDRDAREVEHRLTTLEASVGTEYAELVRRIGALDQEKKANRDRLRQVADDSRRLERLLGELQVTVEAAAEERAAAETERERTQHRLVAALDALAGDAAVDLPGPLDTATGVLAVARAIASAHERLDSDQRTLQRLSDRVANALHQAQAALGARGDFDRELVADGWWVLRTVASGVRRGVGELAAALATQLDEGRAELATDEEQLFERTLAGSVRRALADRIRQATGLVDAINDQLAVVKTAAGGVGVRLRWDVDREQPAAVTSARSLLLRDPADLSEQERASLQEFVRARVDQARAELEPNAPWEARLRETLDYRSWHRFTLQLAHRDWPGFEAATPRRLQKLSTGERSIALHLPMIASVAAHYAGDDGEPSACPRLILLDELFAGVDTANRAQLFGTFTTWDLDAVFTSDSEWCQYATLDGIAIHHLHPPTATEPVTSTRFTWDGRRRAIEPAVA